MASTASGVTIPGSSPTTTPATPIQDHWNNLGKTLNGKIIPYVATTTARGTLVTSLATDGYTVSSSAPAYSHRGDAAVGAELEVTEDGSTWRTVESASAWATQAPDSGWSISENFRYRRVGNSIQIGGALFARSGSTLAVSPGNHYTLLTLPSGFRPVAAVYGAGVIGVAGNLGACLVRISTAGVVDFNPYVAAGTIATGGGVGNSVCVPPMVFEAA